MLIPNYETRLQLFGFNSLSDRYKIMDLLTFIKISKGSMSGPSLCRFSDRVKFHLIISRFNTRLYKNSYSHGVRISWNSLVKNPPESLIFLKSFLYSTIQSKHSQRCYIIALMWPYAVCAK